MRGGELVIGGDATRPCGNMKDGTCRIFGTVHRLLPTFKKTGTRLHPDSTVMIDVYTGDVANRGKGTLMVASRAHPPE